MKVRKILDTIIADALLNDPTHMPVWIILGVDSPNIASGIPATYETFSPATIRSIMTE